MPCKVGYNVSEIAYCLPVVEDSASGLSELG